MNNIQTIRRRLGMSQASFGEALGVSQGNISHYELGKQEVPPSVARRVIELAEANGHVVTFNDIYEPHQPSSESVCAGQSAAA